LAVQSRAILTGLSEAVAGVEAVDAPATADDPSVAAITVSEASRNRRCRGMPMVGSLRA
jgi:hypothetical protein